MATWNSCSFALGMLYLYGSAAAFPDLADVARRNPLAKFKPSAWTKEEMQARLMQAQPPRMPKESDVVWSPNGTLASVDSMDWEEKGILTPIKNQEFCGSCWAMATAEEIESFHALQTGQPPVPLSVQQLVSCNQDCGNCVGGMVDKGFDYAIASGVMREEDYPYKSGMLGCGFAMLMGTNDFCIKPWFGHRCLSVPHHCPAGPKSVQLSSESNSTICFNGRCDSDFFGCCLTVLEGKGEERSVMANHQSKSQEQATAGAYNVGRQCLFDANAVMAQVKVSSVGFVKTESDMLHFVSIHGPLAIYLNAAPTIHYSSGIMTDCDNTKPIDHAVQLVGFGEENGIQYWRIRNSWGVAWGEKGFIRLERNKNSCNMVSMPAVYPVLSSESSSPVLFA